jgi:hypothetical protein
LPPRLVAILGLILLGASAVLPNDETPARRLLLLGVLFAPWIAALVIVSSVLILSPD